MKAQMDSEAGIGRGVDRQREDLRVPSIDLEVPQAVSTATFALG
ncbi:MAG: hypothetical protein ACYC33_06480 [Thermoleophilia bacterium]